MESRRKTVVSSDEFEQVFGSVGSDTLHSPHLFDEIRCREWTRKPLNFKRKVRDRDQRGPSPAATGEVGAARLKDSS